MFLTVTTKLRNQSPFYYRNLELNPGFLHQKQASYHSATEAPYIRWIKYCTVMNKTFMHTSRHVLKRVKKSYLELTFIKVLQPLQWHYFIETMHEFLSLFGDSTVKKPLGHQTGQNKVWRILE